MPKTIPVSFDLRQEIIKVHYLDPSRSARKIAKEFGLHHKTVSKIINARGECSALDAESLPAVREMDSMGDVPLDETAHEEPDGTWVEGKHYVYNGTSDSYVTMLKCRPKPLVMTGTKFRAMKRAYSNWDGNPATLNEVCRRFAIPRDQLIELKSIHGWTHEQEPFTREEVMALDVEDLADDAFQRRRQAVWESFEKKKWHQTKEDALKWNNLEQNFIVPLQDHLSTLIPSYTVPRLNIRTARNPFAVVTGSGELHYGGSGWVLETGENYSRAEAADRLQATREVMLEEVADKGRPDVFFYASGNDYFTVDTDGGTTTKGTPQEIDGTAAQILSEGVDLAIRDIDILRQVAPVRILFVPGNHDRLLSLALLKCLEVAFQDKPDVHVQFSARTRAYDAYGNTLMGFGHGDMALRPAQYMPTMAVESPALWADTIYRAFFTGHLHSEVVRELVGGTHYQMPSLRGKDRFHERQAYLANAALASYMVDKQRGVTNTIYTRV